MASRHSYIQFYPSDWLAGMSFVHPLTEWLYLQICLYNWDKAASMPEGEMKLRFARCDDWETRLSELIDAGKVKRARNRSIYVDRAMAEAKRSFDLWKKKSEGGKNRNGSVKSRQKKPKKTNDKRKSDSKTLRQNQNQNQNQSSSNDEPPHSPPDDDGENGDLIFSIDADLWKDFREHRRKLKAPMTDRAETMLLKKLEGFSNDGHDPNVILERSIENGWKGVFVPDRKRGGGDGFTDACDD